MLQINKIIVLISGIFLRGVDYDYEEQFRNGGGESTVIQIVDKIVRNKNKYKMNRLKIKKELRIKLMAFSLFLVALFISIYYHGI